MTYAEMWNLISKGSLGIWQSVDVYTCAVHVYGIDNCKSKAIPITGHGGL
jgi:hypothetical protein